jgi:hypothetical protein
MGNRIVLWLQWGIQTHETGMAEEDKYTYREMYTTFFCMLQITEQGEGMKF